MNTMKPEITLERIWQDEDLYEFRISASDGESVFVNRVYVGLASFDETIEALDIFKDHVYGGIYDIEFGTFGPEYANGAFHARLHFQERGKIYISIKAESEYTEFGKKTISSQARLYNIAEPAQLDKFIIRLKSLSRGNTDSVCFENT